MQINVEAFSTNIELTYKEVECHCLPKNCDWLEGLRCVALNKPYNKFHLNGELCGAVKSINPQFLGIGTHDLVIRKG